MSLAYFSLHYFFSAPKVYPGEHVTVVGFGYTDETALDPSTVLREVELTPVRSLAHISYMGKSTFNSI